MGFWRDTIRGIFAPEPAAEPERKRPAITALRAKAGILRAPSREDFKAWYDDDRTQFVLAAMSVVADEQKATWIEASWTTGEANPMLLLELRTRADAYAAIEEATYEALCEWLGVEPEPLPEFDEVDAA